MTLNWFIRLLMGYCEPPSFHMINDEKVINVFVDASLEGLGTVWRRRAFAEIIPRQIQTGRSIVHFEMYNVSVAIAHWGMDWMNRNVKIHLDNMAVVQVVNSMRTNDEFLGVCIRNILCMSAPVHICNGNVICVMV